MTGSVSAQRKRRIKTPDTALTPAERAAKVLAFRGPTHNYNANKPTPANIHVASSRFATV